MTDQGGMASMAEPSVSTVVAYRVDGQMCVTILHAQDGWYLMAPVQRLDWDAVKAEIGEARAWVSTGWQLAQEGVPGDVVPD